MKKDNHAKRGQLISICLIAALAGLLAGCGSGEKQKVTLVITTTPYQIACGWDSEVNDNYTFLTKAAQAFSEQYEEAEVSISISQVEAGSADERISAGFDTEGATDILFSSYFTIEDYVYTGRVVPLNDIITEEIRNDIAEEYWEASTMQDKIYIMPFFNQSNVLAYNKELFRQAGLEEFISDEDVILSWTWEEWQEILAALAEGLPDHVYPMMMYAADEQGDTHIMALLQSQGGSFFDEDGRIACNTPKIMAAMKLLRDYNEKGYFPPNAETLAMMDNYNLFVNQQLAIYVGNLSTEVLYREKGIDYGLVNFPSADRNEISTSFLSGFEVFDNGDETKLEAAKAFVRFIYESDWLDYSAGLIPVSGRVIDQFKEEMGSQRKYVENQVKMIDITGGSPNWNGIRAVFYPHIQDLLYGVKSVETIAQEIDDDCNEAIDAGYKNSVLHD